MATFHLAVWTKGLENYSGAVSPSSDKEILFSDDEEEDEPKIPRKASFRFFDKPKSPSKPEPLKATLDTPKITKDTTFSLGKMLKEISKAVGHDETKFEPPKKKSLFTEFQSYPMTIRQKSDPTTLRQKFGQYESKIIGRGTTCCVRLLVSHPHGKDAVKKRKEESEKEYLKKLTSEFCISSSLCHENIVKTLDLLLDDRKSWCEVMEYCSGGTLMEVLKQRQLSGDEINCCFKQLIRGVAYLHSMGIAHRDLKPDNLLFDAKGKLKISDFGTSDVFKTCFEKTPHLSKGLFGSKPYIAPEEFDTSEYDGREVDVWAVGVIYYTMLYTGLPWLIAKSCDSNYKHFLCHRKNDYKPIDSLEPGLRDLLNSILEPNPRERCSVQFVVDCPWFDSIYCILL